MSGGLARLLALLTLAATLTGCGLVRPHNRRVGTLNGPTARATSGANVQVLTEPDQGTAPLLALVRGARSSIDLVMYEFQDTRFAAELAAAAARGVHVRVLLNSSHGSVAPKNVPIQQYLSKHRVKVKGTSNRFAITHQKTFVVDRNVAAIMTINLTPQFYPTSRDFIVLDRQPHDIAAIEQTFDNDWRGQKISQLTGSGDLIWSPGAQTGLVGVISAAKHSVEVYNESVGERGVAGALCAAARRGVKVRILMTDRPTTRRARGFLGHCGATSRTYPPTAKLYIHAKVIVVDKRTAFVGSQNFSYAAIGTNRELGVVFDTPAAVKKLAARFELDWAGAH